MRLREVGLQLGFRTDPDYLKRRSILVALCEYLCSFLWTHSVTARRSFTYSKYFFDWLHMRTFLKQKVLQICDLQDSIVVGTRIELVCQDWESCILTVRWTDQLACILLKLCVRKEGDSNPRYENSHGSLANCWFQPLTHPSIDGLYPIRQALFLNAVQRYEKFLIHPKLFRAFFEIIFNFAWCLPRK